MDAYGARFSKLLIASLEEGISGATIKISTIRATDYAMYCEQLGYIAGLKAALEEACDLEQNMDRPETQRSEVVLKHRGYES